jgi:6-phosphofructokinase 1
MNKIMVLTSGGDSPGMNAALRAVVRSSIHFGLEIFGCPAGFQGLVEQKLIPLYPENVANCIQAGGTFLKADRSLSFFQKETRDQCRRFLEEQGIQGIIVLGGNGSFSGASLLSTEAQDRFAVIGVPCTIDNDIPGTDYTLGFDTARNNALQAIDKIRDTASSHYRHFLVEVMGRNSGALAVDVGIAGGAEIILIPEFELPLEKVAQKLLGRRQSKLSSIIVVAEANQPGRSIKMAEDLHALTKLPFRVCILGYIQRGGSPTALDRKTASSMGYLAVKALLAGESHKMVALSQDTLSLVPFPSVDTTRVFKQKDLLEMNDILCS